MPVQSRSRNVVQETSFLRVVLCLKGTFDIVSMERMLWTNQEQDI